MSSTSTESEVVKSDKYPAAIPYIIGNEAAERFSFYGMKSILVTFLAAQFFNPTHNPLFQTLAELKASEQVHFFVALAYSMPMVGAIMADWFFGKFRVILYVSIVYCIGHGFLALFDESISGFTWGLILIGIGAGGIKSCVSANVGDQFDKTNEHLMSKVYGWFYFAINAGAFVSIYLIPKLYHEVSASVAFGLPGILMAIATLIFWLGRKKYVNKKPSGVNRTNFVFVSFYSLMNLSKKKKGEHWLDIAKGAIVEEKDNVKKLRFDSTRIEGIKAVYRVLSVFLFIPIFWGMWDMNQIEWIQQAQKMDLNLLGVEILPEQMANANSIFLLLFLPILTYIIYPFLDKLGFKPTLLKRFGYGLFITALSFVVIALIQSNIDGGGRPSGWWQILAYALLSFGEAMVSPTGLEYAYTRSPISMKSTMTAIWLLMVAIGNIFAGYINSLMLSNKGLAELLKGSNYYWFYVILMLVNVFFFILVSRKLQERIYVGDEV